MPAPRKYPQEMRERAQRLVVEAREQDPELSLNAAVKRIGARVGVNPDTLRGWCKQAAIDAGERPGTTTVDAATDQGVGAGGRGSCKRANEILLAASSFLRAGARPATAVVVDFIDAHRDRFGVEPICRVLTEHGVQIAPSTYYAARNRPPSARAVRDERCWPRSARVHADRELGRGLYGARKVWHQLRRGGGVAVGRWRAAPVERLMRAAGLRGARRGRQFVTTRPTTADSAAAGPGRAGLHRRRAEPAVGGRLHLRPDLVGDGVHRVRLRRRSPAASSGGAPRVDADRAAAGRAGDGVVDPAPGQATRPCDGLVHHSDAGLPVHRDPLRQPAARGRRGGLHRHRRRLLRQRHGRVGDRALQDRMRPPRRTLARRGRPRARHPVLGRTGSTTSRLHSSIATSHPSNTNRPTTVSKPPRPPAPGEPSLH